MRIFVILILFVIQQSAYANPYWDPNKVPDDASYTNTRITLPATKTLKIVKANNGINILRIQVDWQEGEKYTLNKIIIEPSGTPALLARSKTLPQWGSYRGVLKDSKGTPVYFDSVGTGSAYRHLTRAMTFRFPIPSENMTFELYAEDPQSGEMKSVFTQSIFAKELTEYLVTMPDVEVRELALAKQSPSLRINIYAEGYKQDEMESFWQHAQKTVRALQAENFPGVEHMSFYAVFHASNTPLGKAKDLGLPVNERDSFLGLYYPYWLKFGRWYNVVYPTREAKMRDGLAVAPYDYPIVLINNNEYWGVGNYMAFTAIPAASTSKFTYLLLHEFGHFFGLNEEYQGGGPTELEFAKGTLEPWSQNITFLRDTSYKALKWNKFVDVKTALPTPYSEWKSKPPVYGAYQGGYADSKVDHAVSHIPGLVCVMESNRHFCEVCKDGVERVVKYGLGQ